MFVCVSVCACMYMAVGVCVCACLCVFACMLVCVCLCVCDVWVCGCVCDVWVCVCDVWVCGLGFVCMVVCVFYVSACMIGGLCAGRLVGWALACGKPWLPLSCGKLLLMVRLVACCPTECCCLCNRVMALSSKDSSVQAFLLGAKIPSLFVEHHLQEYVPEAETMKSTNKEVNLEGPSGKLWPVSICGMKVTSFGFKKGWRKFAIDHHLAQGDVLVMKMISKAHFSVQMFGKFGLEKNIFEIQELRTSFGKRKCREETEGDCHEGFSKRLKNENLVFSLNKKDDTERSVVLCSKGDVPSNSNSLHTDSDEFVVLDEDQRVATRNLFPQGSSLGANIESIALSLQLQNVEDLKIQKEDEPTNPYTVVSQRRPVSQAEKEAALNTARTFKTTLPAFRKIMTKSHVYRGFWLGISRDFAVKYLPSETQQVVLMNSSGKEWKAKLLGSRLNPGLSGGWKKFALDNLLEEGDVCIFELKDAKKLLFEVHIYRVLELNTESKQQRNHVSSNVRGKMRGAISRSEYQSECREKLKNVSGMPSPSSSMPVNDHNTQPEKKVMQEGKLCGIELEICHHLSHMIMEKKIVEEENVIEQQIVKPLPAIVKVKEEVDVDEKEASKPCLAQPKPRRNVNDAAQAPMRNTSKEVVPKDDGRRYYEVERLISRRKGKAEDEFLVLLGAEASRERSSKCDKEDGGWWVPMSCFKPGFKACCLL